MKGGEHAKAVVVGYVAGELPGKVDELEQRLGVDPANPRQRLLETARAGAVLPGSPRRHDGEWPVFFVELRDTVAVAEEPDSRLTITYRLRVWLFARGQEVDETDRRRDRLMLALRELLVERPSMGTDHGNNDGGARVRVGSLRESYGDLGVGTDGRAVAGGFVDVDVDVAELVAVEVLAEPPLELDVQAEELTPPPATIDEQLEQLGLV